jgi:MFS transporter, DHA1 family, tetracycline resistance protein
LWLIVLIDLVGFGLTTPSFPLVMQEAGASPFWVTFAGPGIYSFFQLIFTPFWGRMSDAYGRRPILMLSMAGAVVSYIALAFIQSWEWLIVARAVGGIMSGNIGAAYAYVSDVSEPKDRAKFLGILGSAFGLGFMLGPLIGGFLGTLEGAAVSLKWPALVAAVLAAVAFVGTLMLLQESLPPELRKRFGREADGTRTASPLAALSSRPTLLVIVITALVISIAGAVMQSIYPVWALATHGHDTKWVGIAFAVMALLAAGSQAGLVGVLAKRLGERGVAATGIVGFGVGLAMMAFVHEPWALWPGLVIAGLGLGLTTPSLSALASFQASPQERGTILGAFQSGTSLGRVIGPALAGPIYALVSHSAPFILAAALAIPAMLMLWRVPEPTVGARYPAGSAGKPPSAT